MESIRAMMNEFFMMPDHTIRSIALRCESVLWRVYNARFRAIAQGAGDTEAIDAGSRAVEHATERLIVALRSRGVPGAGVIATAAKARFFESCQIWEIGRLEGDGKVTGK